MKIFYWFFIFFWYEHVFGVIFTFVVWFWMQMLIRVFFLIWFLIVWLVTVKSYRWDRERMAKMKTEIRDLWVSKLKGLYLISRPYAMPCHFKQSCFCTAFPVSTISLPGLLGSFLTKCIIVPQMRYHQRTFMVDSLIHILFSYIP